MCMEFQISIVYIHKDKKRFQMLMIFAKSEAKAIPYVLMLTFNKSLEISACPKKKQKTTPSTPPLLDQNSQTSTLASPNPAEI